MLFRIVATSAYGDKYEGLWREEIGNAIGIYIRHRYDHMPRIWRDKQHFEFVRAVLGSRNQPFEFDGHTVEIQAEAQQ